MYFINNKKNKKVICLITVLSSLILGNVSYASPDIGASMVELEQFDVALGDKQYQVTKAHTVQGNLIDIDNTTVNSLFIKDQEGNKLANIYLWKNYIVECDQLLEPVVYNITDKNEYQFPVTISCGDSIKIREAK